VVGRKDRTLRLAGVPLNLSGTPAVPGGAPPTLGEHTDSILKDELGLGDDRIAALRKEGAI
jgi:crotonobetainyl-CoA:carnitine CoA-transferase CaiB-like acyl-CoA transferase